MSFVSRRIGLDGKSFTILQKLARERGVSEAEIVQEAVKVARERGLLPTKPEGKIRKISFKLPADLTEGIENLSGTVRAGLLLLEELSEARAPEKEEEIEKEDLEEMASALDSLQRSIASVKGILARRIGTKVERSAEERAYFIGKLIQEVIRELEYFKEGSADDRRIFREIVPPEDVGYMTTLLKALFSEDQFQRWILLSNYRSRGLGHG